MSALGVISVLGCLIIGGCPGESTGIPDALTDLPVSVPVVAGEVITTPSINLDELLPEPGEVLVTDIDAATMAGEMITIRLLGASGNDLPLVFTIESPPERGTLGTITPVDGESADITYYPPADFSGVVSFVYSATDGEIVSEPGAVNVVVLPEVRFSVEAGDDPDGLTVVAHASTVTGEELPDVIYEWAFDDDVSSGPRDTHAMVEHRFSSYGVHFVRLSLTIGTLGGVISCSTTEPGYNKTYQLTLARADAPLVVTPGENFVSSGNRGGAFTPASKTYTLTNVGSQPFTWSITQSQDWIHLSAAEGTLGSGASTTVVVSIGDGARTLVPDDHLGTIVFMDKLTSTIMTSRDVMVSVHPEQPNDQPTLSGRVSDDTGAALPGVVLMGLPDNPATDASGYYTVRVASGFSGTVTPTKAGYTFSVTSRTYTNVTTNRTNQDYTGTPVRHDVSGTVTGSVTVGAQLPVGAIDLVLTGTGSFAGTNYNVKTNADGTYTTAVVDGWTGTIAAANPSRCILYPTNLSLASPVSDDVAGQNFNAWRPPVGVPMPTFGVTETHYMYAGQRFDFDGSGSLEPGEEYRDAGSGPYTHYIDSSHPSSTDSGNPFGTAAAPRKTIPTTWLPAGSVVEIHNGPYSGGWRTPVFSSGTASKPVFVRGVGSARPMLSPRLAIYGSYVVVEGVRADRATFVSTNDFGSISHAALRHVELTGADETGVSIANWGDADKTVSHVLIMDVFVHDMGDINATYDQDYHAVAIGANVSNCWLLDCKLQTCSGSGLQINAGSQAAQATTHHIYAGRNDVSQCRQSGLFAKQSVDVVFSQNVIHDILTTDWSPSKGLGYQYAPERLWILYNRVYACEHGVYAGSDSGLGFGQDIYIVGNLLYDIHTGGTYNANTAWSPAAIMLCGGTNRYIVNNTIYDADAGINGPGTGVYHIVNNIVSKVTEGHHVFVELGSAATTSVLRNTILHQPGDYESVRWGSSTVRTIATIPNNYVNAGVDCSNEDPLFTNAAGGDFHVQSGSPAVEGGMVDNVYATFESLYGLDIRVDNDGGVRPQDGDGNGTATWDIGSFER